mmetsp:Transcript_3013/g.9023  ORF Transcript_3013/g.9023 Transcript_3013/m.9023 type:complete len:207 (+) Transcript_3013:52-672(+)
MARGRVTSFDQDLLSEPQAPALDAVLSSSWPAATASRLGPEPPRAPSRKPSDADWEVPPLHLPTGPRKRSCSADGASSSTTRDDADGLPLLPAANVDEDEEEEEGCVFAFDGEHDEAGEEYDDGQFQLQLVGLDDDAGGCPDDVKVDAGGCLDDVKVGSPTRTGRSQSFSTSPQLGASPTLLSALERVAAEAGSHLGASRYRIGTI